MRIYTQQGSFDLPIDFVLEISKQNPFLSEQGEQSLPITLPATPNNKRLCGYSSRLDNLSAPLKELSVIVEEGILCHRANLCFSSYSESEIVAALYLNQSDFYSIVDGKSLIKEIVWETEAEPTISHWNGRINQVALGQIRRNWLLPEVATSQTITLGAAYVGSSNSPSDLIEYGEMRLTYNMRAISIFKTAYNEGQLKQRLQNEPRETPLANPYALIGDINTKGEGNRSIWYKEGSDWVRIPELYMITPMLRLLYVLEELFDAFGFVLDRSNIAHLDEVIIANNVIDAFARGKLYYAQLLPDCSITDFLKTIEDNLCAKFVFTGNSVRLVFFSELYHTPPNNTLDRFVATDNHTLSTERERFALAVEPVAGDDYWINKVCLDGSVVGTNKSLGGYPAQRFPIDNEDDYNLYKAYTKNYLTTTDKVDEERTITTAGIAFLSYDCRFLITDNPNGQYLTQPYSWFSCPKAYTQCAVFVDPVHLNSQKVKYKNGQMIIDQEAESEQSDKIVLLQQHASFYYINFYLFTWKWVAPENSTRWVENGKHYRTLCPCFVGMPLHAPASASSQERFIQHTMEQGVYQPFNAFRNRSNYTIETEVVLPLAELLSLDITQPTLLQSQPVLIESIDYTLPATKESIQIKAHTLQSKQ